MQDFIEIKQGNEPHRLINIQQIADVTVTKSCLRLKMSYGDTIMLEMPYEEFVKLVNIVAAADKKPMRVSTSVLSSMP